MKPSQLYDGAGRQLTLGKALGTGGEGSVYDVAGQADRVAKVYHKSLKAEDVEKLRAMPAVGTDAIRKIAAWPLDVLSDRPGGPVVGLTMKKVAGFKELHTLYSPAQRKAAFPDKDWKFLAHVAANCAAAFDTIHAPINPHDGIVVGDVNERNLLVNADGFVNFIDCDSYQVQVGGRVYPCKVGVPLFTPPELMGQAFHSVARTPNHDRFGLAVLLFHLLMMGRHPFSGRYAGTGEMPIEKAIQEYRFAYGRSAAGVQMQPPLFTPPLAAFSPRLVSLFEQAFSPQAAAGGRPAASDWHPALVEFRDTLRQCSRDPGHQYSTHASECVWCEMMKAGAPNYFISVAFGRMAGGRGQPFALAAVWAKIDRIAWPEIASIRPTAPPPKVPRPWPPAVLSSLPAKPKMPAILTKRHVAPEPVLPPAQFSKVTVPTSRLQLTVGCLLPVLLVTLAPAGFLLRWLVQIAAGVHVHGGIVLGIDFLIFGACCAWWVKLEFRRRLAEAGLNVDYEAEQREHRRLAKEQYDAWKEKLDAAMREANRQYGEAVGAWEKQVGAIRNEADLRRTAAKSSTAAMKAAETTWAERATALRGRFEQKKKELAGLRDAYQQLDKGFAVEHQQLVARAQEFQRQGFLQQHFIDRASIPDIGPTRKATLASWGIETALDIIEDDIRRIPGFGEKLTGRLLAWRAKVEAEFRFDPAVGVPENERQALALKYYQLRQPLETRLQAGEKDLSDFAAHARAEFDSARKGAVGLVVALAQATADVGLIPKGV